MEENDGLKDDIDRMKKHHDAEIESIKRKHEEQALSWRNQIGV